MQWYQVTIGRILDDGKFIVDRQEKFPSKDDALDWARRALAVAITQGTHNAVVNVVACEAPAN